MKILAFPGNWEIDIMEIMRTGYEKNMLEDMGFAAPQYKDGIFLFVCFSPWRRLGYVEQLKDKSGEASLNALKNATEYFKKLDAVPKKIICDEGKEFNNDVLKDYLKEKKIKFYIIPKQYYTHNSMSHLDSFIRFIRGYLSHPITEKEGEKYYRLLRPTYESSDTPLYSKKPYNEKPSYIKTTIGGLFVCRLSDFNDTYNYHTIIREFNAVPAKISNVQMFMKLLDSMNYNKVEYEKIKQRNYKVGDLVHMKFLKGFSTKTGIKYSIKPYKIIGRIGNRFILKLNDPKESTVFFRMIYDVKPYNEIESIRDDLDENYLEASNYFLYESRKKNKSGKYTVTLSNGEIKKNVSENQFFEYHKSIVKLNLKSS